MIGLGTMGENLALNLMDHGTPVAVWNLEPEWTDRFVAAHPEVVGTKSLAELVRALEVHGQLQLDGTDWIPLRRRARPVPSHGPYPSSDSSSNHGPRDLEGTGGIAIE